MTDPHLFWTIFAAALGALLLAGMFFGSMIAYHRLERQGEEAGAPFHLWIGMLLPLAAVGLAFHIAMS